MGYIMRATKLLLLAITCTTAAFGAFGVAHADGNDDAFIEALNAEGIGYPNSSQAISSGKAVCSYIIAGRHSEQQTAQMVLDENPKLSPIQAVQFVNLARGAYCPLPPMGGGGGG
ncbi:DUF732 domain-containing protein [Mycobacterium sp. THU-M104]|uniref:DUF732 domain-containing protein n=1 Tax=Mycobacterium sp. THU-M104 TaxID=3410515 RepID=UPI003B99C95C